MATENSRRGGRILFKIVYVVILLALAGFGGLYFKKYQDLKKNPPSADQVAQAEVDKTIAKVSQLYALPKDEKPSVATVKDITKLKDQPFFTKAQNGDITLIYSNAKLAILYRPSTNKIINVSSVTIQNNARVKVIGSAAARQAAEAALTSAKIAFADGGDAKSGPQSVTVVDLTGQNGTQAQTVANTVKGQVGSLPAGEDKPTDADILVIAGP